MKCKIVIEKGKKFGRLTAIEIVGQTKNTSFIWSCKCECGNIVNVIASNLRNNNTKSCGCLQREQTSKANTLDLLGQRFGRLLVIEKMESTKSNSGNVRWKCRCDCGKETISIGSQLTRKKKVSCGCYNAEKNKLAYGQSAFNNLLYTYKNGAKKRNIKFELSEEEFKSLITQNCKYCGSEPKQYHRGKNGNLLYNGIDRVDNADGYNINNVVPCCKICNCMKRNMTLLDFKNHIKKINDTFNVQNTIQPGL